MAQYSTRQFHSHSAHRAAASEDGASCGRRCFDRRIDRGTMRVEGLVATGVVSGGLIMAVDVEVEIGLGRDAGE